MLRINRATLAETKPGESEEKGCEKLLGSGVDGDGGDDVKVMGIFNVKIEEWKNGGENVFNVKDQPSLII